MINLGDINADDLNNKTEKLVKELVEATKKQEVIDRTFFELCEDPKKLRKFQQNVISLMAKAHEMRAAGDSITDAEEVLRSGKYFVHFSARMKVASDFAKEMFKKGKL